jgi:hypothetical protein
MVRDMLSVIEFSDDRNRRTPRVHRRSAESSMRSGRCEVALDVENVVDGGVVSWWRSIKISASSVALDRNSPMTAHQTSLSMSPM